MKLSNSDPNFSVIVPGPCNAACPFCFWKERNGTTTKKDYLKSLTDTLGMLPQEFRQCSITGGEPTASNYLEDILPLVRSRFGKVVLSSNGFGVLDTQNWLFDSINHLNISRHHWQDKTNYNKFGTTSVPSTKGLKTICEVANEKGVDVTLNCVLPADFADLNWIELYLIHAKDVGANAVCFRKEHGTLDDLPVEALLREKVIQTGGCPACRSKTRLMKGMTVTWRYGVLEPSKVMPKDEVYELVFQQDGSLTADWGGKVKISKRDICSRPDKQSTTDDLQISCSGKPYLASNILSVPNSGCGFSISGGHC